MPRSIESSVGPPLGFPGCPRCPYVLTGPASVCVACASAKLDTIVPSACPVCSQIQGDHGCPNWLCQDPLRQIKRISAIAYSSGPLRATILRYKYQGGTGWRLIFGRLLLGWLEQHAAQWPPGLIVANPTFVGEGTTTTFAHTEAVLEVAEREDVLRRWPFDVASVRAIVKTRETAKSAGKSARAKREAAVELRQALSIPDRGRTEGRRILVYDDVCTTGSQLDAVARCLVEDGRASEVQAVVLARAPWAARS